MKKLTIFSSEG